MAAPMRPARLTLQLLKTSRNLSQIRHAVTLVPKMFGGKPPVFPEERKRLKEETPSDVKSLEQIYKERNRSAVEASVSPVNIGREYTPQQSPPSSMSSRSPAESEQLERAARNRTLKVSVEEVRELWLEENGPLHKKEAAAHYGIFRDLFADDYFYPATDLRVAYDFDDEFVTPVHRGNVIPPSEVSTVPRVEYDCKENSLWTLVLTNPDGHLTEQDSEYLHWMVGNIPGCDVSKGEELCSYLQPIPPRGTGFHRHVFLLFKQDGHIDYSPEKRSPACSSLRERTFKTYDFFKSYQDALTPTGLCFFQSEWDPSVQNVYHNVLEMREPEFEYKHPPYYHPPLKTYPHRQPFDRYYDRYRDKKDLAEEVMKMKMLMISPFQPYKPAWKYPLVHLALSKKPSWLRHRENLMHRRREQFQSLPK